MEIGFFISELLIQYNEVSLIGFGTFCKNNKARYNPDDRKFYPPANRLSFKNNEGDNTLLFKYISKIKNISEASAEYFANKFVKELKQQLDTANRAEILPLGEIEKSDSGYVLKQVAEIERTQYYGLVPVPELLPAQDFRFSKAETFVRTEQEAPILFMNESSVELVGEDSESNYSWIKILVTLAVCIIIGVSGYVWYKQYFYTDINISYTEDTTAVANTTAPVKKVVPVVDSITALDTLKQRQSKMTTASALPIDSSTTALRTATVHENNTFEIIAAAFGTEKEALEYISLLKKKGIEAKVAGDSKRNIKISLGSYTDKELASKALTEIRKNFSASAWIYEWKIKK